MGDLIMKKLFLIALAFIGFIKGDMLRGDVSNLSKIEFVKEFAQNNPKSFAALALSTGYVVCKVVGGACKLIVKAYESSANAIYKEVKDVAQTVSNCPILMATGTFAGIYWIYNTQFEN